MMSRILKKMRSPVQVPVSSQLSDMKKLIYMIKDKFPDVEWSKTNTLKVETIVTQLRQHLSQKEMHMIVEHMTNVDSLIRIKNEIVDVLIANNILNETHFLFNDEMGVIYAKEYYLDCLIDLCVQLQKLNQLTASHLEKFIFNLSFYEHFDKIQLALNELYQHMHDMHETVTAEQIDTLSAFPDKALLVVQIILQAKLNEELKSRISDKIYCELIQSYFADHPDDTTTFGFDVAVKQYLAKSKQHEIENDASKIWAVAAVNWQNNMDQKNMPSPGRHH